MKSAIVLGVHSFAVSHSRTGIQHMAMGLAERGVSVDYLSVPASPFDLIGQARRQRLIRYLRHAGNSPNMCPASGLHEFTFFSMIPIHSLFVPHQFMLHGVHGLAPRWLQKKEYGLCLHDVGPTMAYLPKIKSEKTVLRLNDGPRAFATLPVCLVKALEKRISEGWYDEIWAVSTPLVEHVNEKLHSPSRVRLIPNGGPDQSSGIAGPAALHVKRAVCLGSYSDWLDPTLVLKAAALLPDWEFHFVGAGYERFADSDNVRFLAPVDYADVPRLLRNYSVGLLPYKDDSQHMRYVHRPLKFYEYYACGLGVAAADVGGLREGLGEMASYGRNPEEFAQAVLESVGRAGAVSADERRRFLEQNSWAARMDAMWNALEALGFPTHHP